MGCLCSISRRCLLAISLAAMGVAESSGASNAAELKVAAEGGNVVLYIGGTRKGLTATGRDSEPVLTPDRKSVVYTRSAKLPPSGDEDPLVDCTSLSSADELRQIRIDGSGDELLLRGRGGAEPSQAVCSFQNKQFSADGATMYFLAPAWTTSSALHTFSFDTRTARYLMPSNDFVVLSWCTSDLKDGIIAQQHRYFRFGGSYDWYWLFDRDGKTEVGPVGEFNSVSEIKSELDASGQCLR